MSIGFTRAMVGAGALLVVFGAILEAQAALAIGVIETPAARSTNSGIGILSGWHCSGSVIEVAIDGGAHMMAGARTPRGDTQPACGRTDTGWSLLYNFNLLDSAKAHRAVAYAEGVEFARVAFQTTNFGVGFAEDLRSAACSIFNFPDVGDQTFVVWNEANQNFSIESTTADPRRSLGSPAPPFEGTYHGAATSWGADDSPDHLATFTIAIEGLILTLTIEYAEGGRCQRSAPWAFFADGIRADFDPQEVGPCGGARFVIVDGKNLYGGNVDLGGLLIEGVKLRS